MSGTDITNLLDIVQRKINAVDSSASTSDLLYLLSAIRQSGEGSVFAYDNESQIPNLLDPTPDPEMITYTLDSDKLYFQRGSWVGKAPPIRPFQGSNYGYTSGGQFPSSNDGPIDKFPFASDGNATDVGDLTSEMVGPSGQSSATHGYTSGGNGPVTINKFPFSADGNATDIGDLTVSRVTHTGQSSIVNGFGYASGGAGPSNVIDKFPFTSDANATDVGDLTLGRYGPSGQSSTTSGYTSGGSTSPTNAMTDTIDKFPFTSDANATDVGNLTVARRHGAGQSSTTHGYTSGGGTAPPAGPVSGILGSNVIDKFSFSADGNATDVGDLTVSRYGAAGQSSTTHGYSSGGTHNPLSVIDKFPFSTDANATDVGDLTVGRWYAAGQQY